MKRPANTRVMTTFPCDTPSRDFHDRRSQVHSANGHMHDEDCMMKTTTRLYNKGVHLADIAAIAPQTDETIRIIPHILIVFSSPAFRLSFSAPFCPTPTVSGDQSAWVARQLRLSPGMFDPSTILFLPIRPRSMPSKVSVQQPKITDNDCKSIA